MTTATGPNNAAVSDDAGKLPHQALPKERLHDFLKSMMLIRRFEERTMQAYMQQKIGGFCHIYIGQEAVAVGSIEAVNHEDPIVCAYRDHGHALARGMHPNYCMAEMFGKITGCAKGKGGSMHMFDKPNNMFGGHAIVGGQCPLGVGLGWAIQYNKENKVALCYLGDGALNQGAFHEAMNLAAIWKLPLLFILENNRYSMGTSIERGTAAADNLQAKAEAYNMRYAECDGLDVLDVYDTVKAEADRARIKDNDPDSSEGPAFLNIITYRYQGHSMSDPQKYRTKDEVEEHKEIDPIARLSGHLLDNSLADEDAIAGWDSEAKQAAIDAVHFAEESEDPSFDELYTDVYVNTFGKYKVGELPQMLREQE